MRTHLVLIVAVAMIGFAVLPVATADPGNGNSWFGLCTAYDNNENGRENGNAGNAPPFQQLQEEAERQGHDTVEEFCETVPHPGGGSGGPPSGIPDGPPF